MDFTFGWTEIEDIAEALEEGHPEVDPATVRFTELRELIENLDGFEADPEHTVNEQILEAIQAAWLAERSEGNEDQDERAGYQPNNPFR